MTVEWEIKVRTPAQKIHFPQKLCGLLSSNGVVVRTWAIPSLFAIHVLAGLVTAYYCKNSPILQTALHFAVITSQASLLGIWSALSSMNVWLRLVGVACGCGVLGTVLSYALRREPEAIFYGLVVVATCVVAVVVWLVRLAFRALLTRDEFQASCTREGLQFGIRHLMQATFVIACLLTIGKLATPFLAPTSHDVEVVVLGLCYASVALVVAWAMLGLRYAVLRALCATPVAAGTGWLAGSVVDGGGNEAFWISTTLLQALLLIASLWVVRAAGYRVVRHPTTVPTTD